MEISHQPQQVDINLLPERAASSMCDKFKVHHPTKAYFHLLVELLEHFRESLIGLPLFLQPFILVRGLQD